MYVQKINSAWTDLPVGLPVIFSGFAASYGTVELWTEAERNAFGVYSVTDNPPVQNGKIAVAGPIIDIAGKPVRSYTLIDAPIVEDTSHYVPASLLRQRAMKVDIWPDLAAYIVQYPELMLMVLTLEVGIDPKYPALIEGFNSLDVPQEVQDYLLSDPSLGV